MTKAGAPIIQVLAALLLMFAVLFCPLVLGAELTGVSFEEGAKSSVAAQFQVSPAGGTDPKLDIRDSYVTLTFSEVNLAKSFDEKAEYKNPHFLIEKLVLYSPYKGMVRAQIIVNGSNAALSDRVQLVKSSSGFKLTIEPPKAGQATLDLLKKEDQMLLGAKGESKSKVAASAPSMPKWIFAILSAILLGGALFFVLKNLKRRLPFSGSRKYLIEQLSYSSLGPKTGVALYKIGSEFVLLGVTSNQISFLSNLPKLQRDYEEETDFDRGTFKKAVREEMGRSKPSLEA